MRTELLILHERSFSSMLSCLGSRMTSGSRCVSVFLEPVCHAISTLLLSAMSWTERCWTQSNSVESCVEGAGRDNSYEQTALCAVAL